MSQTALAPGHGHVIVCGLAHLGLRTIDELRRRDEDDVGIGPGDDTAAIVMTGEDDLENLNVALAAQELNPGIRVVIRMFDAELGSHIPELFHDGVALSSSALAAPGFVSAAIDGESGGRFELAGRVLSPRTSADPAHGARSVPLARLHADRSVDLLPDAATRDP